MEKYKKIEKENSNENNLKGFFAQEDPHEQNEKEEEEKYKEFKKRTNFKKRLDEAKEVADRMEYQLGIKEQPNLKIKH